MKALTYVEIDVPAWTQTSPDSPTTELTHRFAVDTNYLPNSIPAIASIKDIAIEPATISLGVNLGQRAVVTVTFRDHRHIFNGEEFSSGTFWGKFRARYGLTLQGNPFRLIRGTVGQTLEEMETRHFMIDTTEGPTNEGDYKIIAKDIFSFTSGERAQAPLFTSGTCNSLSTSDTTLVLSPAGIGAEEYGSSGFAAIGGKEIVFFTAAGPPDTYTITRALFNTVAQTHTSGDRVQLCLSFINADPADLLGTLLVTYGGVDPDFVPLADWQAETAAYLGATYTGIIADPKPVDQLVSEIIEQASLALWWDDINNNINLQVLQPIPTTVGTYDQDNMLVGTLEVTEQPEKRLSEVQVYFGQINPLNPDDQINNYTHTARTHDETAVLEYGSAAIKRIFSRWIPDSGLSTATTLSNKQLGRYRDPPRMVKFHLPRDVGVEPQLGGGYQLGGSPFQTMTGEAEYIPIQITRLAPFADHFQVEAEEVLWTPFGADIDPVTRVITLGVSANNINLRDLHDQTFPDPQSGDIVHAIVPGEVIIGSTSTTSPAMDIGTWPAGVTINLTVNGRIQGKGGDGGAGGNASPLTDGSPGQDAGTALYTRQAINLTSTNGAIWGGGGGQGGDGAQIFAPGSTQGGNGGGGGAGTLPGQGGPRGLGTTNGNVGANASDEAAGFPNTGAPGTSGSFGQSYDSAGGESGDSGPAVDGWSNVTQIGPPGLIQGPTVN